MNGLTTRREVIAKPHLFTEQNVRRLSDDANRQPEMLYRMMERMSSSITAPTAQISIESKDLKSSPDQVISAPEVVTHFFTQFDLWIRNGVPIEKIEVESLAYLPAVLAWLDTLDFSVFENEIQQEFQQMRDSEDSLWTEWLESEKYVSETDSHVFKIVENSSDEIDRDVLEKINTLWMRRYLYQVLVRKLIHFQIKLPEVEHRYLIEQLWQSAHTASGLMYSLLPPPPKSPKFEDDETETTVPARTNEDDEWLEASANDDVC